MQRKAEVASGGGTARRWLTVVPVGVLAVATLLPGGALLPGTAAAQSTPDPDQSSAPDEEPVLEVPDPIPGEDVCAITDPRLAELSGLVATEDGFIVVNDGQDFDDRRPIFFLDSGCNVVDEQSFFPGQPRDPEGMELSPDGTTLWVGDIGDNPAGGTGEGAPRETVALWRVDLSGGDRTPVIHRFVYPDGQPRDAEALLLNGDGTPIIISKAVGPAELFIPTDLQPDNPPEQAVPLEAVGQFDPPDTGSDNRFGAAGRRVITGGAVSPDGTRVVLRTYADALEFDVVDGDVIGAITTGQPRVTPLPDEPQGEAITYSADGSRFLTVSDNPEDAGEFAPAILSYTPTEPAPPPPSEEAAAPVPAGGGGGSLFNSVQDVINVVAAVGVLGLLLVAAGVFGTIRARRRSAGRDGKAGDEEDGSDGSAEAAPATGRARLTREPEAGWEPDQAGAAPAAGVYSSRAVVPVVPPAEGAAAEAPTGTTYGASGQPGTQYGGGQYAGREYGRQEHAGATEHAGGQEYGAREYGGQEYAGGPEYGGAQPTGDHPGGAQYNSGGYGAAEHGGQYDGGRYAGGHYGGGHPDADHYDGGHYDGAQYDGAQYDGGQYEAGQYGGAQYDGGQYGGHAGPHYAGDAYGGQEHRGQEFGGQEYGGQEYAGQGYAGQEYGGPAYSGQGYDQAQQPGYDQGWNGAGHGGAHPGGGYTPPSPAGPPYTDEPAAAGTYRSEGGGRPGQSAPEYSDDPDYPYEFRDQNRW